MGNSIIAIDGYSSCGKSTVARALANKIGYIYIDSGAMYRAVALYCLQNGIIADNTFSEDKVIRALGSINLHFELNILTNESEIVLNSKNVEKEIRGMNVASVVSAVSALAEVRETVVNLQRELGSRGNIVMDGRDIGTNVFPDAQLKIFMTADESIRAQRRFNELLSKGENISLEEVKSNISMRDYEDTHRKHNPLIKAVDAIVLDNTNMSMQEQLDFVLKLVIEKQLGFGANTP